ncbi:MAG: SagB/ThcOx family dehydrogenase [Thermofilaceae archaeon]
MERISELPDFKPTLSLTIAEAVLDAAFLYEGVESEVALEALSKIVFAAQGCTARAWGRCLRAAPSAGATYPLRTYVVARAVRGLEPGVYSYQSPAPLKHALRRVEGISVSSRGSFAILFEEVSERTTGVYGERGYMYIREEVGHAAQGALLEASALGLAGRLRKLEPPLGRIRYCVEICARGAKLIERRLPKGFAEPSPAKLTLEEAIVHRRSVRKYSPMPLRLDELSSILLWSISGPVRPYQPLTSYRVTCYLAARSIKGLDPGVYRYSPEEHELENIVKGDVSARLAAAALGQEWVARAPLNIVLCTPSDSPDAELEAGMVGQNIYLSATSLGLGTVAVGAFYDDDVASVLRVDERPLYIFPVGRP